MMVSSLQVIIYINFVSVIIIQLNLATYYSWYKTPTVSITLCDTKYDDVTIYVYFPNIIS